MALVGVELAATITEATSMHKLQTSWLRLLFLVAVAICVLRPVTLTAADEPALSNDQIKQFLLTAKVIGSRPASKGTTSTLRLTLSDGTLSHDARQQAVNEHNFMMRLWS